MSCREEQRKATTAAAWRPARGVPQAGCASGSFPAVSHRTHKVVPSCVILLVNHLMRPAPAFRVSWYLCPPAEITNTLRAGYRTAQPSDSPPRSSVIRPVGPSASVPLAASPSKAVRPSFRVGVSAHMAHFSGRGAPSRVASPARQAPPSRWAFPLDRAPSPRCYRKMCAEAIRVRSSFSSPNIFALYGNRHRP